MTLTRGYSGHLKQERRRWTVLHLVRRPTRRSAARLRAGVSRVIQGCSACVQPATCVGMQGVAPVKRHVRDWDAVLSPKGMGKGPTTPYVVHGWNVQKKCKHPPLEECGRTWCSLMQLAYPDHFRFVGFRLFGAEGVRP